MSTLVNTLVGEYRVTELLGAGGMGEVYKATHTHFGRLIAIKVLLAGQTDSGTLRRFYGEASIQASLHHPGVAEYLGFYEYKGRPCILMEYVNGETISAILERRGPFAEREALVVVRAVVDVVAHFHSLGVLHRDIKSSNIKVTSTGSVKLLDFGIARFRSASCTTTGVVVGTPAVLAPEQVKGQNATEATDVWQLGVLMYEMLTGRLPFHATSLTELYAQILNANCIPVSQLQSKVAPALEKIVSRCLQKDPSKRFASGKQLLDALDSLEGKPVREAVPASVKRRKNGSRGYVIALVAAAILLVTLGIWAYGPQRNEVSSQDSQPSAYAAWKTVTVDTSNGMASVFRDGALIGNTPYELRTKTGDRVDLLLRREGYKDLPVQFEVTERRMYTYTMESLGER